MALDRCIRNEGVSEALVYDERGLVVFLIANVLHIAIQDDKI